MSTEISNGIGYSYNLPESRKIVSDHINNLISNNLFDNQINESLLVKYTKDFIINDEFISSFRNQLTSKFTDEFIQKLVGKRLGDVALIKTEIVHDEFRVFIEFK
ncbi:hypothetical protein YerA41_056 [Yersinia phage YerA41]|nr:hypothetical protein YerA41_056 [Yersinia phage YerA41]